MAVVSGPEASALMRAAMRKATKSQRILALHAALPDMKPAAIGKLVSCRPEYVRSVYQRAKLPPKTRKQLDTENAQRRVDYYRGRLADAEKGLARLKGEASV